VNRTGEAIAGLALADTEYFGGAGGARTLGSRSLVLQGDRFGTLHFNLFPAFHAISLHHAPPILSLPSRVANLSVFVNRRRLKIVTIFGNFLKKASNRVFQTDLELKINGQ
jgi:hypothetical protein